MAHTAVGLCAAALVVIGGPAVDSVVCGETPCVGPIPPVLLPPLEPHVPVCRLLPSFSAVSCRVPYILYSVAAFLP